jgi:hypothetical protein
MRAMRIHTGSTWVHKASPEMRVVVMAKPLLLIRYTVVASGVSANMTGRRFRRLFRPA